MQTQHVPSCHILKCLSQINNWPRSASIPNDIAANFFSLFRKFYYVIAFPPKYYDVMVVRACAVGLVSMRFLLLVVNRHVCFELLWRWEQIKGPNVSSNNPGEHQVPEQGSFKKSWLILLVLWILERKLKWPRKRKTRESKNVPIQEQKRNCWWPWRDEWLQKCDPLWEKQA